MVNINELTIENSAMTFIDHQPFIAFAVRSISGEELNNNVVGLAKMGLALEIPIVLSTVFAKGQILEDPIFSQIAQLFPDVEPIDRSTTNAWSDPNYRQAIEATGRKKIIMCGLYTEICVAHTALSMVKDGYDVYVVTDACGGVSVEAHERAVQRMIQAGIKPTTWYAVVAELVPEGKSEERQRLYPIAIEYGGASSWSYQYVMAQMAPQS